MRPHLNINAIFKEYFGVQFSFNRLIHRSLKSVIEKLHRERSGLTTALCAFLVCKKAAHAGEIIGEKTSQRAPPCFFVEGGSVK